MATYEFWLLDDTGRRMMLLEGYTYAAYSRSVSGFGTFEIGFPYQEFSKKISPIFRPDWRIDVWRSPAPGIPMRREQTYLLRMHKIDTRTDGVQILKYYCRDPKDLLNRRYVLQAAGLSFTRKTDYIDDMMKAIVREQMLYGNALDPDGVLDPDRAFPTGEFLVQANQSLGPSFTYNFSDRNVLDILKELQDASFQLALDNIGYERIYFDVVPYELKGLVEEILDEQDPTSPILDEMGMALLDELSLIVSTELGFRFETYSGLRGKDRTQGVIFSVENNNLLAPFYSLSHLEEVNTVIVKGFGRGDSRAHVTVQNDVLISQSRWARYESFKDGSDEPDQNLLENLGQEVLYKGKPEEEFSAEFLNVPGGPDSPRSLYAVDWDLGDLLPVRYAGKSFDVEVDIVYIAISEDGKETISGRSRSNAIATS